MVSVFLSVILHVFLVQVSLRYRVATPQQIENEVVRVFKVEFKDLESRDFVSRPTTEQLQLEREQVLREEIDQLSQFVPVSVDEELESMVPAPQVAQLPVSLYQESDDLFENDQLARNLISSAAGRRAIRDFEQSLGNDLVQDTIDRNPIALTGRGTGTQSRLVSDLPEPSLPDDPIVSQSLSSVLNRSVPPPSPDLEVSEPPIELPPVTELLPSPELAQSNPGPTTLASEQVALKEIQERFCTARRFAARRIVYLSPCRGRWIFHGPYSSHRGG